MTPVEVLGDGSTRDRLGSLASEGFIEAWAIANAEDARKYADAANGPVVMKVDSDQVVHKSEHGFVELGLAPEEVDDAFGRLQTGVERLGVDDARFVMQPEAPAGLDLFVGISRDETFGPMVLLGLGGVTVELFRDVARGSAPVSAAKAENLIDQLQSAPLVRGFRGGQRYATHEFAKLVSDVSHFAVEHPRLLELDLNPVRLYPDGRCLVLDARSSWAPSPGEGAPSRDRRSLEALFRPNSVAVVGASRDPQRPGAKLLAALRASDYRGRLAVVHPTSVDIEGVETVKTLGDLTAIPDMVAVALAADDAVEVVGECVALGVPAVMLLASGFSEAGPEGWARESRLREKLAAGNTVVCGPNTIGLVNPAVGLVATFSQGMAGAIPRDSGVTFIAQSGAVAGSLVSRELAGGHGIGTWVTVGNQVDLDVADYIHYLVEVPETKAIALFLEGVSDGSHLREALATAAARGIPVAAFKTGLTEAGSRAVSAHSGALAGSSVAYTTTLAEQGVAQVAEMASLLEVAWVLGNISLEGRGVAIVTTSGGAGSATVDAAVHADLDVSVLSDVTLKRLAHVLPSMATATNPLDVTAEGAFKPGVIEQSIRALQSDAAVSVITVVLTSIVGDHALRVASEIVAASQPGSRPLLVTWLVDHSLIAEALSLLALHDIRVFDDPARMMRALGHAAAFNLRSQP